MLQNIYNVLSRQMSPGHLKQSETLSAVYQNPVEQEGKRPKDAINSIKISGIIFN